MAYTPQAWVDNNASYPASAARMLHIESGIEGAADTADAAASAASAAQADADTAQTAADAAQTDADAALAIGLQPGDLVPSAATSRTGCLLCDGSSYLRATYSALFAAIGTAYGSADGTHFNVPDLRGRVPLGAGTGTAAGATAHSRGAQPTSGNGGEEEHTLTGPETGANANTVILHAGDSQKWQAVLTSAVDGAEYNRYHIAVSSNNSFGIQSRSADDAHNIMQPVSVINWFIKT